MNLSFTSHFNIYFISIKIHTFNNIDRIEGKSKQEDIQKQKETRFGRLDFHMSWTNKSNNPNS